MINVMPHKSIYPFIIVRLSNASPHKYEKLLLSLLLLQSNNTYGQICADY